MLFECSLEIFYVFLTPLMTAAHLSALLEQSEHCWQVSCFFVCLVWTLTNSQTLSCRSGATASQSVFTLASEETTLERKKGLKLKLHNITCDKAKIIVAL